MILFLNTDDGGSVVDAAVHVLGLNPEAVGADGELVCEGGFPEMVGITGGGEAPAEEFVFASLFGLLQGGVVGILFEGVLEGNPLSLVTETHADGRFFRAVEDVGVDGGGWFCGGDGFGCFDAELVVGGAAGGFEIDDGLGAVEGDGGIATWGAIRHGGVGDAEGVGFAGPPGAADGDVDDVVVGLLPFPAVVFIEKLVGMPVGVSGDGHRVGALFDEAEEVFSIAGGVAGAVGGAEGDVHHEDEQFVLGDVREEIGEELELFFAEFADVATLTSLLFGSAVEDVVEGAEVDRAVLEGVVGGAEDSLEGFVGVFVVGGVEVEVVIADEVEPGAVDEGDDGVVVVVDGEVVEDDVTEGDAEGCVGADEFGDGVLGHVAEFLVVAGLGVAEEDRFEGVGLGALEEGEVDGFREWAGGGDTGEAAFGGTFGFVDVVELGELLVVDGSSPVAGFDDEEDAVVGGGEGPIALGVGCGDLKLVGDQNAGEAGFVRVSGLVVVEVVKDRSAGDLVGVRGEGKGCEGSEKGGVNMHGKDYWPSVGFLSGESDWIFGLEGRENRVSG